jgi:hypothetical protein
VFLLLCVVLQAAPQPAAQAQGYAPSDGSLERIKRALAEEPEFVIEQEPGAKPRIRVRISQEAPKIELPWIDRTIRSAYVRPSQPPDHYEFLKTVTPEEFRGGVLHPIGVDLVRVAEFLGGKWNGLMRERREKKARREVEEDLRQFLAATKKPER